jgi:signal transduction histidine kinase/CheY-like chemotaxis protein/streptogramin lyase
MRDRDGGLWAGTWGGGVNRYENGRLESLGTRQGLSDDVVRSLFEDREGSLWIGTNTGGLNRLHNPILTTYSTNEGFPERDLSSIVGDSEGNLWIGTNIGGILCFRPPALHEMDAAQAIGRRTVRYNTENGLPGNVVTCSCPARDGSVWIGTTVGLARWEKGRIVKLDDQTGLPRENIYALLEDAKGDLWIASTSGVHRWHAGRLIEELADEPDWVRRNTTALALGSDGRVWAGTVNGIRGFKDGKQIANTNLTGGLIKEVVSALHPDGDDLWFGAEGGVLYRLHQGTVSTFTIQDRVPIQDIGWIDEDGRGFLWFACSQGILRIRKQELIDFADGQRADYEVRLFDRVDGLKTTEMSAGGWKTRDGRFWFASAKGLVMLDPEIVRPTAPPQTRIERLIVEDQEYAWESDPSLAPGLRRIEIHYTAMSLLTPHRTHFRCRLEGIDKNWIDVGTRRVAYYTSLPPGDYRFLVEASNDDGDWNETPATLQLTQRPFIYQTKLFYLCCVLAVSLVVLVGSRRHIGRLHAHQTELERRVAERTRELREEIKARTQTEEQLRLAKDAAEQAVRVKSSFLANMSHEIRTPMNGVLGMTALALETDMTPEQRHCLETVQSSGQYLLRLLDDILDFSKIEAGKLAFDSIEFSLRDLLSETMRMLAQKASAKGLELAWHATRDVPDRVVGDPGRLRQVLVNLVGNAIKFTAEGDVSVEVSAISATADHAMLHFQVRDTGIGIEKAKHDSIFRAFEQADSSMSRKFGGTGLGLAIAAQLVEMMHGKIEVESEPGKGSRFDFNVRLRVVSINKQTRRLRTGFAKLIDMPVLVADDNSTSRRMLEDTLSSWGMRPKTVSDGAAAIALLKSEAAAGNPFGLAILDESMPGRDGPSILEWIGSNPQIVKAAVLLLSPGGVDKNAERCRDLPWANSIIKPASPSDLLDAVARALMLSRAETTSADPGSEPLVKSSATAPRILLAEDNEVNQEVTRKILERRGYRVTIARTGQEAVTFVEQDSFDAILMDVQMPEMDGMAATAAIRERERTTGAHVPIIAMTAHAMKGDRERCLNAGMDSYISKPVQAQQIVDTLNQYLLIVERSADIDRSEDEAPFNPAFALDRAEGDHVLLERMVKLFIDQSAKLLPEMAKALAIGDAQALERAAHKLRGSMGIFGAAPATRAANRLEELARSGALGTAVDVFEIFSEQVDRLRTALEAFVGEELHAHSHSG